MGDLLSKVSDTISKESLISDKDKIFVAISGGADSVALLMALHIFGYKLNALHCNFNLRGEESYEDQRFVESLCRRHNIECSVISFDTISHANENKISVEMAARDLRYRWFEEISKNNDNALIAIAHNSDDSIETVFLNLVSGTGIRGLTGIRYSRDGYIVRPLLDCSRTDILNFLKSINQDFRTDSSNESFIYKRNFIRHKLLPLLEELNPSFRETMLRNIDIIRFNNNVYTDRINQIVGALIEGNNIIVENLLALPFPKKYILYEVLSPYNFNIETCRDMGALLERNKFSNNKTFYSCSHKIVTCGKIWQIISREQIYEGDILIDVSKNGFIDTMYGKLSWEIEENKRIDIKNINSDTSVFDYDKILSINSSLMLRRRKDADFIKPFGMNGKKKKISRILIDNKLTPLEKDAVRLLVLNDDVLWVVGMKCDSRYRVLSSTKNIITFKFLKYDI